MKDIRDYSLLAHNTFGIDAKCKRFLEYSSVEEAQQIVAGLTAADQPLLILGGGSNLLLTGDYQGTVLHSAIKGIEVLENGDLAAAEHDDALLNPDWAFLNCGSGEVFDDVVAYAVEHDFYGAENLSIIPGEVGASAIQNIGAYGVEAKDIIYHTMRQLWSKSRPGLRLYLARHRTKFIIWIRTGKLHRIMQMASLESRIRSKGAIELQEAGIHILIHRPVIDAGHHPLTVDTVEEELLHYLSAIKHLLYHHMINRGILHQFHLLMVIENKRIVVLTHKEMFHPPMSLLDVLL